jgi:hypothetical protein
MKIIKTVSIVAAPFALTAHDLASTEGGAALEEQVGGQDNLKWFDTNKPHQGQSRDSYAKWVEGNGHERKEADRYWDWYSKQDGAALGNVGNKKGSNDPRWVGDGGPIGTR